MHSQNFNEVQTCAASLDTPKVQFVISEFCTSEYGFQDFSVKLGNVCGFLGVVGPGAAQYRRMLVSARPLVRRRGPDSEALQLLGRHGWLYASRLAFQDPAARSNQPFAIPDSDCVLAYNGEVFNLQQMTTLLPNDTVRRTESDTEVVGLLLSSRGPSVLSEIDGLFALAFWNESFERLLLARDPQGRKPLYYSQVDQTLAFGSDAGAVARLLSRKRNLEEDALARYLMVGFLGPTDSGYSGVKALAPGSILEWAPGQTGEQPKRLFASPEPYTFTSSPPNSDPYHEFRESLVSATRHRAMNERVAVTLSGGMDSTAVLLCCLEAGVDLEAFSVIFPDSDKVRYNEDAKLARRTADELGVPFREVVAPSASNIPSLLGEFLELLSAPNANPTSLTQMVLQKEIRRAGIRVTLTGDGSDELLFGYRRYSIVRRLPLLPHWDWLAHRLLNSSSVSDKLARSANRVAISISSSRNANAFASWHQIHSPAEVKSMLGIRPNVTVWPVRLNPLSPMASHTDIGSPGWRRQLALAQWDRVSWLADESNLIGDAVSMGTGGEIRCPFQSRSVIQGTPYIRALDKRLENQKPLLSAAFPELLDLGVVGEKRGFISPAGHWLRRNADLVNEEVGLLPEMLPLSRKAISETVNRWQSNRGTPAVRRMWLLWVLSKWLMN